MARIVIVLEDKNKNEMDCTMESVPSFNQSDGTPNTGAQRVALMFLEMLDFAITSANVTHTDGSKEILL